MFFTRIKRGAIRTNILLRSKASCLKAVVPASDTARYRQRMLSGSSFRTLAMCTAAAYTAVMPVLPLRAQAAYQPGSSVEDAGEPPSSLPGLPAASIDAVKLESQVISSVSVTADHLADVSVGESRDTVLQEQQAAQRQAELEQLQAEQARQAAAKQAAARRAALAAAASLPAASGDVQSQLRDITAATFGADQWPAMYALVKMESGFNPSSYNHSSGACGLFQALPCSKMGGTDLASQFRFGISYIRNRYGTPQAALAFHNLVGWY